MRCMCLSVTWNGVPTGIDRVTVATSDSMRGKNMNFAQPLRTSASVSARTPRNAAMTE